MRSVLDRGHHHICDPDGSEELFDVNSDPDEYENILSIQSAHPLLAPLRATAAQFDALRTWCPPPPGEPARLKRPAEW